MKKTTVDVTIRTKGGKGSGNFSHAGRPGKIGGSVVVGQGKAKVTAKPAKKPKPEPKEPEVHEPDWTSLIDRAKKRRERISELVQGTANDEIIYQAISHGNPVPIEHLERLHSITTDPPPGYTMSEFHFVDPKDPNKSVAGAYNWFSNTVHIHPRFLHDRGTVTHEIGHHVAMTARKSYVWESLANGLVAKLKRDGNRYIELGITRYGLTNAREFLAEAYTVWTYGDGSSWSSLKQYWKKYATTNTARNLYTDDLFSDIEGLFGERPMR